MRGDRLEALYTVAIALGLRQGEALGLRWDDVDFNAGILRVQHTIQKIDGEWRFVEPKTDRSRRTISLPSVTVSALQAYRTRQDAERQAACERWQE